MGSAVFVPVPISGFFAAIVTTPLVSISMNAPIFAGDADRFPEFTRLAARAAAGRMTPTSSPPAAVVPIWMKDLRFISATLCGCASRDNVHGTGRGRFCRSPTKRRQAAGDWLQAASSCFLSRFRPPRWLSLHGIVRPVVFGVSPPHFLPYVEVRRSPEAREISCDLHGPVRGREEMHCQGHRSSRDARRVRHPEH